MTYKDLFKSKKIQEIDPADTKKEEANQKAAPANANDKATTAPKS